MPPHPRHVVWFSCGVPSACLAKIVVDSKPGEVVVAYCDTSKDEHPDNRRFMRDVKFWIDHPITVLRSEKFQTVEEVADARSYMAGIAGAPCTVELKKVPRFKFQRADDIHYFGLTADEWKRIERFEKNNPDLSLRWPLRDKDMTRERCEGMVIDSGIALPAMYELGYKNNNCIGCVKATSSAYWIRIRRDFPEQFATRAAQSRRLGARLVQLSGKRIFLDELPPEPPMLPFVTENISCGPECADGGEA